MEELGRSLVEGRRRLEAAEAMWLGRLAVFDRLAGWQADGHLSCVGWLVQHCGMAHSTAKEKLRVALELARRPVLAAAYAAGALSYSKLRAVSRIDDGDDDLDRALVEAAATNTAADLEGVVRHWKLLRDQDGEGPPVDRWAKRGVRRGHTWDGMATAEVVLPVEDRERVLAILDAHAERQRRRRPVQPVEGASAEATGVPAQDPLAVPSWSQRRADALLALLEAGLAHLAAGEEVDPERAVVEVISSYESLVQGATRPGAISGGQPLSPEAVRPLACDAGLARIIVKGHSEVLDVGRTTRQWNRAQRRAIRFGHGGRCAFPGCGHRLTDIHHTGPWSQGGATDLDLGVPLCWGHHHLVHDLGWTVEHQPAAGTVTFTSPDGRHITATPRKEVPLAA